MEEGLSQNHYFIDLKNEQNAEDIMQVLPNFFFTQWRFPETIDHLPIIPARVLSKKASIFHPLGCTEILTMTTRGTSQCAFFSRYNYLFWWE